MIRLRVATRWTRGFTDPRQAKREFRIKENASEETNNTLRAIVIEEATVAEDLQRKLTKEENERKNTYAADESNDEPRFCCCCKIYFNLACTIALYTYIYIHIV